MIVVEHQGGGRCAPGLAFLRTWTQRELPACIECLDPANACRLCS
ncbi:hypothetical protein TGAM01_v206296 [Trichoderma gamsii]|uniref:Uncharacterized protein n=1 Tax=Trichoderma gamsii TaxID=398673 RepID=A0A2P4ZKI8_9HYPO|nr:hypothetical protein TGAM01_v206296 [Trichoderma gamsii]PON24788.1 hypothetical protein TGAM01_v206296 [Trichoderma gamsii]